MTEKSFSFALRIVKLYQHLSDYRLRFLYASKYLSERQFSSLHTDCEERIRILGSARLTMKTKLQKGLQS